jgi:hypothetical protein
MNGNAGAVGRALRGVASRPRDVHETPTAARTVGHEGAMTARVLLLVVVVVINVLVVSYCSGGGGL